METGPSSSTSSSSSSCASTASHSASASASASLSKSSTSINSTTAAAALACPDDRPITSLDKRLYLAIDCGGTKAAAVISDQDGHVVGRGFGGPANFTDVGLDAFLLSVQEAIHQALGCCKNLHSTSPTTLPPGVARRAEPLFEAAWLGIAGVDSEVDVQQLTPYLATLLSLPYPSNRLMVANDTSLLAAPVRDTAHPDIRSGVVVIAGTGSIVMSFKADDGGLLQTLGRVGGFGWLLGDEGSGYWVGRDALRFILDQADRDRLGGSSMFADDTFGSSSSSSASASKLDVTRAKEQDHLLRDRILDLWNLTSVDELLNAVYSNRNPGQPRTPAMRSGQSSPPEEADPAPRLDDLYIPDGPLQQTMSGSGPTAASSSSDRDGDRLVRLMPPAAAPATHLGPTLAWPS
ncbi:uncharacterized protein PFL1_06933 [Pseudozyma flocculosa PF-1]|uniref:N-acetyl-D-glucosamine kinase n=1 Tax=Pseudozyma flocculosa PF-1 TaxID=1277687 RepID=A0A061H0S4_9BASI|nr:uncharacterized protein PFL1_06933 [Pseudozyma flocculosa PF-1]EPQ25609.1 hypothetical protein PFL1_06933 [Pseudozyma flocculosa PF-1]